MTLYFQAKANKNGNKKQLIFDTDKKTVQKGFYLFGWTAPAVELTPKQIDRLYDAIMEGLRSEAGEK